MCINLFLKPIKTNLNRKYITILEPNKVIKKLLYHFVYHFYGGMLLLRRHGIQSGGDNFYDHLAT